MPFLFIAFDRWGNEAYPFEKWNENNSLYAVWGCSKNPIQADRRGDGMSVPDSIMRQAKDASLPVTIRIGKSGLTDAVVVELSGQLSSRSLVKAKVNRGLFQRDDLKQVWQHLADETSSQLIFVRGNVAVFWKN